MTQTDLGKVINAKKAKIYKIETGSQRMTLDEAIKLARKLNCHPGDLMDVALSVKHEPGYGMSDGSRKSKRSDVFETLDKFETWTPEQQEEFMVIAEMRRKSRQAHDDGEKTSQDREIKKGKK